VARVPLSSMLAAAATFARAALGPHAAPGPRRLWLAGLALVVVSLAVKSLHAVDLAPLMYSHRQPGTRMAARYDETAVSILRGEGILFPRHPDPEDTGRLARPPGYPMFLAAAYTLVGRNIYAVQAVHNLLNSACPLLVMLIGARVVGWRAGLVAGALASLAAQPAWVSNLIGADALCALPLLAAMGLLAVFPDPARAAWWRWVASGILVGAAVWLRPNVVLFGPFLALFLCALCRDRRTALRRSALLTLVSVAVVAPITIRNYAIYGEWVPVSINGGITLWQGVADAGAKDQGARTRDKLVIAEEALAHRNPRYEEWWAAPDGIRRDRTRYRQAMEVIAERPLWYLGAMLSRMVEMASRFDWAPAVAAAPPTERGRLEAAPEEPGPEAARDAEEGTAHPGELLRAPLLDVPEALWLAPGRALTALRRPVRAAQMLLNVGLLPLWLAGAALVALADWRRALFLSIVPLYYFAFESPFILEPRVIVPLLYFLLLFAGAALVAVASAAAAALRPARAAGSGPVR
jgi:4-amino-4-deoxy-L-arabinose transferase-like glycosyltransferase